MKADDYLMKQFGFSRAMGITHHMEWLELHGADHLKAKYHLDENPTEDALGNAKWKEHRQYWDFLSMPFCFDGDSISIGEEGIKSASEN